jgi:hypothetical protein
MGINHEISGFLVKNRRIRTLLKSQEKVRKVTSLRGLLILTLLKSFDKLELDRVGLFQSLLKFPIF